MTETDRLDELQRLHDAVQDDPRLKCVDVWAHDKVYLRAMHAALPALLRVARAAQSCLDGSAADGWHTPLREVDVVELRAALAELRGST